MKPAAVLACCLVWATLSLIPPLGAQTTTIKPDYAGVEFARLASGKSLTLDLYVPKTASAQTLAPIVLYVHPGGWSSGSSSQAAEHAAYLAPAGFAVAAVNYRLSGDTTYPAQINDCKGAIRWLRANAARYNLNPAAIGAFGHSAGAHLAALVGLTGAVKTASSGAVAMDIEGSVGGNTQYSSAAQAVADFFGPSDLAEFYKVQTQGSGSNLIGCQIPACPDKAKLASPTYYVSRAAPPFLIMHGTADEVVPFSQSRLLDSTLRAAGANVSFTPVQGANHGFDAAWSKPEIQSAVVNFFTQYLKTTATTVAAPSSAERVALLSVAPNPVSQEVWARITLGGATRARLALYDALGREVLLAFDGDMPNGAGEIKLTLTGVSEGAYFLRLQTPAFFLTQFLQVLR